ncbi:hypothetical protein ACOBV8_22195 (plasmid) [Pseudoalteromonas espejiana]
MSAKSVEICAMSALLNCYKPMKNFATFLTLIVLTGCVSPLDIACNSSQKARSFPKEKSVTKINVQFQIVTSEEQINVNETAICDYQGSFCPAGDWYEIWYGNKEIKREITLQMIELLPFGTTDCAST